MGGARNAHKYSLFGESGRKRGPYWSKNLDPGPQKRLNPQNRADKDRKEWINWANILPKLAAS